MCKTITRTRNNLKSREKTCLERETVEKMGTLLNRYILSRLEIQSDIVC